MKSYILIVTVMILSCNSAKDKTSNQYSQKQKEVLDYNSVELFTIDSSIYRKLDTIWTFPDKQQAYKQFLGGGSFIDSNGHPIHNRYKKFLLTGQQSQLLKDSFLYKFCDNIGHACTPMYRDVLIFYDSSHNVVEQAQICFGCGEAAIYPRRDFMCQEESDLDFEKLKQFVTDIKEKKAHR